MPVEVPNAYPEGSNFPIPMAPVSPDRGDLSADSAKNRNLPTWRKGLIAATAFVSGLTAAGSASSALANGFLVEAGGTNPTAECLDNSNLMIINREYADKIASGEIVIAAGPPPIAALEEGDKTAVIQPVAKTPDEAWANLVLPAPECEPKSTPFEELPAREALESILTQNPKRGIKNVKPAKIRTLIGNLWAGNPELDSFIDPYTPTADFSKQYMLGAINGYLFDKGFEFRADVAAGWIAMLFSIYDREEKFAKDGTLNIDASTQARSEIRELTDAIFDYAVTELTVRDQEAMIRTIASRTRTFYEYDVLNQIQALPL